MKFEFVPIGESDAPLLKEGDLIAYTCTLEPEWRDVEHEYFSARIVRVTNYERADGNMLTVRGRSIPALFKSDKVWLLREIV